MSSWLSPWIDANSFVVGHDGTCHWGPGDARILIDRSKELKKRHGTKFMIMSDDDWLTAILDEKTETNGKTLPRRSMNVSEFLGPVCECGGEKANTTHANWCPKFKPFK